MQTRHGKKVVILPFGKSNGATDIAKALQIPQIFSEEEIKQDMQVIGWGSSKYVPTPKQMTMLNPPGKVARCVNKKLTYEHLAGWGCRVPDFTESHQEAIQWLLNGHTVVARLTLDGKAGEGVKVFSTKEGHKAVDIPTAPLYTKYINKTFEYRVHVAFGKTIHVRKKVKPTNGVTGDPRVASHLDGWLFIKSGFTPPPDALRQSLLAVQALGLDFGAVDILYDQPNDKAYVCEVNTAPGLEVSEVQAYADAFKKYFQGPS